MYSPLYILGLVLHDQSDDISGQIDQIHDNLVMRAARQAARPQA